MAFGRSEVNVIFGVLIDSCMRSFCVYDVIYDICLSILSVYQHNVYCIYNCGFVYMKDETIIFWLSLISIY